MACLVRCCRYLRSYSEYAHDARAIESIEPGGFDRMQSVLMGAVVQTTKVEPHLLYSSAILERTDIIRAIVVVEQR